MNFAKKDFHLGPGTYLLSHSVGRPLKRVEEKFQEAFLKPWLEGRSEPWTTWMKSFQEYGEALAALFGESFGSASPLVCCKPGNPVLGGYTPRAWPCPTAESGLNWYFSARRQLS